MFDVKALLSELNYLGLRTARADETGWYYTAWCGARVWVCGWYLIQDLAETWGIDL